MQMSKKLISLMLVFVIVSSFSVVSVFAVDDPYSIQGEETKAFSGELSFNKTKLSLKENETSKLKVKITSDDEEMPILIWSSSNEEVATVEEDGTVTAITKGTAVITVETSDGNAKANCTVTVTSAKLEPAKKVVTKIDIGAEKITLTVNQTKQLTMTYLPKDAKKPSIVWESDDDSIATVSSSGLITAKAEGQASITATTSDGELSATVVVNVSKPNQITKFEFNNKNVYSVKVNKTITLKTNIVPKDVKINLVWTSSKPKIASVDNKGLVTGLKKGETTISVKDTISGKTLSVVVKISK